MITGQSFDTMKDLRLSAFLNEYRRQYELRSAMDSLSFDEFLRPHEILLFKKKFDIADDILCTVLMDIIPESAKVAEWKPIRRDATDNLLSEKRRLMRSIEWLGVCADEPAKKFLMEIAFDETKGETYRDMAVEAYIRSADVQQVKNALNRFLVESRVLPSSTYSYARVAYEETEDDPAKREAIIAALTAAALAQEEDRGYFAEADAHFAGQDEAYAKSPQRKKALQQMNIPIGNKAPSWKLPLIIGTLTLGGGVAVWHYVRKRRRS
jgi:hypothetical protein